MKDLIVPFKTSVFAATFLQGMVFSWMHVFAIVIMPGIARLGDGEYLNAFKGIDGIIQDNQPQFVIIWIGSVLAMIACNVLGLLDSDVIDKTDKVLLTIATVSYLVTQFTTFTKNVPLNNHLKELTVETMSASAKHIERVHFQTNWMFWHSFRTFLMGAISVYMFTLLLRV